MTTVHLWNQQRLMPRRRKSFSITSLLGCTVGDWTLTYEYKTAVDQAREPVEPGVSWGLVFGRTWSYSWVKLELKIKIESTQKRYLVVSPVSSCSNFSDSLASSQAGSRYIQCLIIAAGLVLFSSSGLTYSWICEKVLFPEKHTLQFFLGSLGYL